MTPILLQAIILAFEEAVKLAPGLITDIKAIFAKGDPTAEDWQALRDKVNSKGYFDYVPGSDIPK